jgi:hypothetical protein
MKLELKDCQNLDAIINHLVNDEDFYNADDIVKNVLPIEDVAYVSWLIDILLQYRRNIVFEAKNLEKFIRADSSAKTFIQRGGFTKIYMDDEEERSKKDFASKLELEELVLRVNKLRDEMIDLAKSKTLSKNAKNWSIAAAVATVLTWILLLLQWKCNKPG